jgi:demethylmenaquinone methyltransferase/2-methoxy-6-polyprenyl-1,4-benzoquinol methylase
LDEKIKFFDKYASDWDNRHTHREYDAIKDIFSRRVRLPIGSRVLDVGAGTGIIIQFFQEQNIHNLVAIDLSQRMANQFKIKHPNIPIVRGDYCFNPFRDNTFDIIIIFNAFPHFKNPELVFSISFNMLKTNGILIIAHSMTREELNVHHGVGKAGIFSQDILISDQQFQALYKDNGFTNIQVDNTRYFFSYGNKNEKNNNHPES